MGVACNVHHAPVGPHNESSYGRNASILDHCAVLENLHLVVSEDVPVLHCRSSLKGHHGE